MQLYKLLLCKDWIKRVDLSNGSLDYYSHKLTNEQRDRAVKTQLQYYNYKVILKFIFQYCGQYCDVSLNWGPAEDGKLSDSEIFNNQKKQNQSIFQQGYINLFIKCINTS